MSLLESWWKWVYIDITEGLLHLIQTLYSALCVSIRIMALAFDALAVRTRLTKPMWDHWTNHKYLQPRFCISSALKFCLTFYACLAQPQNGKLCYIFQSNIREYTTSASQPSRIHIQSLAKFYEAALHSGLMKLLSILSVFYFCSCKVVSLERSCCTLIPRNLLKSEFCY